MHLLSHLARRAAAHGYARLRGTYAPGPRNALVADLYPNLGFVPKNDLDHTWEFELTSEETMTSLYIAEQT